MKAEYDFSNAKRNPYAKMLKKQITIRIEEPTIAYFKDLAAEMDVPYQTLINLYLRDCAQSERKLNLKWK
jgi:predicted DNA binding CopG/RHH family protein